MNEVVVMPVAPGTSVFWEYVIVPEYPPRLWAVTRKRGLPWVFAI
jgi:hypothetical protein